MQIFKKLKLINSSIVKKTNPLFLSFLVVSLLLIATYLAFANKETNISHSTAQSVPELADVLSGDQEKRLKATRALAERVGVEEALEIMKSANLPATGETHLAVHQIGFHAYKKYGKDSILHCKDYYLNACFHGAIIEAASDSGIEVIGEMADRCSQYSTRYFQCVHAAGHAILAIWNYDLPSALKTCDEIFENKEAYPNTLSSCHNGAFMENLFGVHDWGSGETPKREWLKDDDPYFPCTAFGEKYQKGCWLNQAARIYQMYKGDLTKTSEVCEKLGNNQYQAWCFDNLARQIHPLTEGHIDKVFNLCKAVGAKWETNCITVNAGAYASVGDSRTGIAICNFLAEPTKTECFVPIVSYFLNDGTPKNQALYLCSLIQGIYAQECFFKVQSS